LDIANYRLAAGGPRQKVRMPISISKSVSTGKFANHFGFADRQHVIKFFGKSHTRKNH
jgi:hypothetical protein